MTVMEFLDKLYATPRMWRKTEYGCIRDMPWCNCPVDVVGVNRADRLTGPGAVEWRVVMMAADNARGHNPEIRRALLAACGLEE